MLTSHFTVNRGNICLLVKNFTAFGEHAAELGALNNESLNYNKREPPIDLGYDINDLYPTEAVFLDRKFL